MPEYAVAVVVALVLAFAYERFVARSGILRSRNFWVALAICTFFMVLTNGWLTKLSAPIVNYDPDAKTPWRFPWDIPIEDFAFGFVLLGVVVARWVMLARREADPPAPSTEAERPVRGVIADPAAPQPTGSGR